MSAFDPKRTLRWVRLGHAPSSTEATAFPIALSEETMAHDVSGWDSLSNVQIVLGVENAFGIRLNVTDIAQMENAGSLIDLVQKHVSADGERV